MSKYILPYNSPSLRFDEGASVEAKLALVMSSEEEKWAKPQRVPKGRGSGRDVS